MDFISLLWRLAATVRKGNQSAKSDPQASGHTSAEAVLARIGGVKARHQADQTRSRESRDYLFFRMKARLFSLSHHAAK
jgi:hypothetical protein